MGVDYRGQLCVGYTEDELEMVFNLANAADQVDEEYWEQLDTYEKLEILGLERYGPYFDAGYEDSIFGWSVVASSTYGATEVTTKELAKVPEMINRMFQEYAVMPAVYIMAEGY